jgi:hypothetical protein
MKNLKINVPKGYEIDKDKSTFDNIVFKKISKLPSSWEGLEDLEIVEGYYVDSISDIWFRESNSPGYFCWKNTFKTREQAEASIALAQLSQLRDVYRQGWQPMRESNDLNYVITFNFNDIGLVGTYNTTHHFLSFQDEETAELFIENFRDLIEKAKPLMS